LKIELLWDVTLLLGEQVSDTLKYQLVFIIGQAIQEGM
jgi:hypothetical protein